MNSQETICAISTPAGVGGIAVLRLSGVGAKSVAELLLRSADGKPITLQDHRVRHGQLVDSGAFVDDVVAVYFKAPHSFTGDDVVEISCHGSLYVQQYILQLLCNCGARLAHPGEFTMRAFLNHKLNLSQAEAVADLIDSQSSEAHRLAVSQLRGGYASQLENLRQQLIDMAALLELELDFSDEELEFASREHLKELVVELSTRVQKLVDSFAMGNALKKGIPVAIIGRPNVGKSSLLNILLNDDRAIVSPLAGTTRDTIEETMTIDGLQFRFIDTAGLRNSNDDVENIGIERAYKAVEQARVIIFVADASQDDNEYADDFNELRKHCNIDDKIVVEVRNKCDLTSNHPGKGLSISAKQGTGIDSLRQEIVSRVRMAMPDGDGVMLTNVRHYEAMKKILSALDEVQKGLDINLASELLTIDLRDALYYLGTITGTVSSEEVLSSVFSRFCIGK